MKIKQIKSVFNIWRLLLPFLYIFILVHFLKDITQDILKISTPLDLFGDVKEDISFLSTTPDNFLLWSWRSFVCHRGFSINRYTQDNKKKAGIFFRKVSYWRHFIFARISGNLHFVGSEIQTLRKNKSANFVIINKI